MTQADDPPPAEYNDTAAAADISRGTDALQCKLITLGIGAADEAFSMPYTFLAPASSIWPEVFLDIF